MHAKFFTVLGADWLPQQLVLTVPAQAQDSIKIGWSISKTGPFAAGASVTTLPNYQVWVKEVNDAGGIMLKSLARS